MTGEKLERPESQNDRNAGTTIKQERSESWNDYKNRNNSCANILTLQSTLPEEARRTELSLDFTDIFLLALQSLFMKENSVRQYIGAVIAEMNLYAMQYLL